MSEKELVEIENTEKTEEEEPETELLETESFKIKRTKHPNAGVYCGKPSMDFSSAITEFLGTTNSGQQAKLLKGTLIVDEKKSADFFDSVKVDDVIGLGLFRGVNDVGENKRKQGAAYKFKILSIDAEKDVMSVRNVSFEQEGREYEGKEYELAFEDLSIGLAMNFGEILYRDDKPYGVSEDMEVKIKYFGDPTKVSGSQEENNETEGKGE